MGPCFISQWIQTPVWFSLNLLFACSCCFNSLQKKQIFLILISGWAKDVLYQTEFLCSLNTCAFYLLFQVPWLKGRKSLSVLSLQCWELSSRYLQRTCLRVLIAPLSFIPAITNLFSPTWTLRCESLGCRREHVEFRDRVVFLFFLWCFEVKAKIALLKTSNSQPRALISNTEMVVIFMSWNFNSLNEFFSCLFMYQS